MEETDRLGRTTVMTYDALNRLTEASTLNGTLLFGYDINGVRTSRSENGITTNYVVDHNQQYAQVLAEIENGLTTKQYTYGDDLLSQTEGAGQERFFLYDGLGTTRALADGSEAVTDTYAYEAFGELLDSTGGSDNAYRYTGEQYDSGLNQYYLRARYYDQGVGRFTQMDTWMGRSQDPVTLNKYIYAYSDPTNVIDPSGNSGYLVDRTAALAIGVILATSANVAYNNLSLRRTTRSDFDGVLTDKELGLVYLAMLGSNSAIIDLVLGSEISYETSFRLEDVLEAEVEKLRERGYSQGISVPVPPGKRGWFACIARAQDLARSAGGDPRFGWGWGLSRQFLVAKNNAVKMANLSIGAVDTHHAQWRCRAPDGSIIRP